MYGCTTTLEGLSFAQALARTVAALQAQGFEVRVALDEPRSGAGSVRPHRMLRATRQPSQPHLGREDAAACDVMIRQEARGQVVVGCPGLTAPTPAQGGDDTRERLRHAWSSLGRPLA